MVPSFRLRSCGLLVTVACVATGTASATGPGWTDDLEAALEKAERLDRPVLVHFWASWCGPCRRMEAEVFPSPEVRELLRDEVVGVKLDADRNQALSRQWGITSIPADVVLEPDGTPVAVMSGFRTATAYSGRIARFAGRVTSDRAVVVDDETSETRRARRLVGLGGYCPVTLTKEKRWATGDWAHAIEHFGVTYLFEDADAAVAFRRRPIRFTPRLSGCDPVAFADEGDVVPGSVESAALFDGAVVLFSSPENRRRFGRDPSRYLALRQVMLPGELIVAMDGAAPELPRFAGLPRFERADID